MRKGEEVIPHKKDRIKAMFDSKPWRVTDDGDSEMKRFHLSDFDKHGIEFRKGDHYTAKTIKRIVHCMPSWGDTALFVFRDRISKP